jgi:hypothetical protein
LPAPPHILEKWKRVHERRPDRFGRPVNFGLPWSKYERILSLSLVVLRATLNRRVNNWSEIALKMDTGRSAMEVSRFFYQMIRRKGGKRWIRRMARAKVGIEVLFFGARGAALQSFKYRKWKLWTTREKRILLFRMIRKPDLLYWTGGGGFEEIARGFWPRTPAALETMYRRNLSVQWPLRRIRSFGTSKKGLYGLRYTCEDYEKMVDWMIRRPRLGYGWPAGKNGSGWHKMALSFPGRTAYSLYKKYIRFLVKIWPLRDIKHEALRRKLENSKPIIE